MNKNLAIFAVFALACGIVLAAASDTLFTTGLDYKISNTRNSVKLTLQGPGGNTGNIVEAYNGSALTYAVPSNGITPVVYGGTGAATASGSRTNLGFQAGSTVTTADGTVTNAFGVAFSVAPIVITMQRGLDTTPTNVLAVTTTNFVLRTGKATQTNLWQAIGTP